MFTVCVGQWHGCLPNFVTYLFLCIYDIKTLIVSKIVAAISSNGKWQSLFFIYEPRDVLSLLFCAHLFDSTLITLLVWHWTSSICTFLLDVHWVAKCTESYNATLRLPTFYADKVFYIYSALDLVVFVCWRRGKLCFRQLPKHFVFAAVWDQWLTDQVRGQRKSFILVQPCKSPGLAPHFLPTLDASLKQKLYCGVEKKLVIMLGSSHNVLDNQREIKRCYAIEKMQWCFFFRDFFFFFLRLKIDVFRCIWMFICTLNLDSFIFHFCLGLKGTLLQNEAHFYFNAPVLLCAEHNLPCTF